MAGPFEFSYEYQNVKRDLTDVINLIVPYTPLLISLASTKTGVTQLTHEWHEDTLSPVADALAEDLDNSETGVDVVDGTKFKAGMIVMVKGKKEQMKVTGITGNTLTVTRGYGGTTAQTALTGATLRIVSKPEPESTLPGDGSTWEPLTEYNYSQIYAKDAKVSKTSQLLQVYGIGDALDRQVQQKLVELTWDMNAQLIYGRRVKRSGSEPGSSGGLLFYISQAGGNVDDASAAAISAALLNDMSEVVYKAGGQTTTLLMNANQARKISAFNDSKLIVPQGTTTTGNYIAQFLSDQGVLYNIVVDRDFPEDSVAFLDTGRINICPLRPYGDEDASPNGADFYARRILGEYTFEIRNSRQAFGLIENLAP